MKALFKDVGFSDRVFHVIEDVVIPDACIHGLHITRETCRVFGRIAYLKSLQNLLTLKQIRILDQ